METKKTGEEPTVKQRKLGEILTDLTSVGKYCVDQNLSTDDMKIVFEPLNDVKPTKRCPMKTWIGLTLLICGVIGAYQIETVSWYFTVIGRLFLINILPLFDWTMFSKTQCVIPKPDALENQNLTQGFNCDVCESVRNVTTLPEIDLDLIEERYFPIYEPFMVPLEESFKHEVNNITAELLNDAFWLSSIPCDLSSNLVATKKVIVDTLIDRMKSGQFRNWFLHFRNCESNTIKFIRYLFQKTNNFKNMYRSNSNWVLMNNKYSTETFKHLDIEIGNLILITQVKGGNYIKLNPLEECSNCHELEEYLPERHSLIFLSDLWKLSYKPDPNGKNNLAIVEEMVWEE